MKKTSGIMLGAFMAALLGSGLGMAVEDSANTAEKNASACEKAAGSAKVEAEIDVPKAQKVKIPGITLINPENAQEAILLVQMAVPGSDGQPVPQLVGVALNMDENGKNLVKDFGITGVKQGDKQDEQQARKQAMEKFVMVSGVIDFDSGKPVLTVEKYESAKNLLAKVPAAQYQKMPQQQTEPAAN